MKKFDRKFIKYSITLFVVSVLLISVGAVSLTRSSERTDKMHSENASARNRIEVLSNENLILKQQVASLSETAEKYNALNSVFEAEQMIESNDFENAKILLEKTDKKYLEGTFAIEKYEKLLEIAKENIK